MNAGMVWVYNITYHLPNHFAEDTIKSVPAGGPWVEKREGMGREGRWLAGARMSSGLSYIFTKI